MAVSQLGLSRLGRHVAVDLLNTLRHVWTGDDESRYCSAKDGRSLATSGKCAVRENFDIVLYWTPRVSKSSTNRFNHERVHVQIESSA
jgi:hypothetical protein